MPDIRHPTGSRLDEAEAQPGKLLGNWIGDEIAKSNHRKHPIVSKGVVAFDVQKAA